jgi:hypothetical protein
MKIVALVFFAVVLPLAAAPFGQLPPNPTSGDRMFAEYFKAETEKLASRSLVNIQSLADWNAHKAEYRRQLAEMLGLDPLPARTDLKAIITGRVDHPEFSVEKLHFQSLPGLYVTANLYLPKNLAKPAPTILYVCGHALVKTNGVSYGNKTGYQHHGAWFARNAYVCLTIDTIQLGEIEGMHHGTYRFGHWWWNSRGYTPAGIEAWNGIRALDYLETRPEVDKARFGITGRSGGGAYSWWIAALDERVKVAAPVAGITDLKNHVVDGVVEGHCDCMFQVNNHRWDYAQVAALVAPRPLLIANTDKDPIFPLDGVVRVHEKTRRIYDLHKAGGNLGLLITEGPHKDTQDLQVPVFRWFNRFLKDEQPAITLPAEKIFTPAQLKVFEKLPGDERVTKIHDTFVRAAGGKEAITPETLRAKVFAGWPEQGEAVPVAVRELARVETNGVRLTVHEFESQPGVPLRFYLAQPLAAKPRALHLEVVDDPGWRQQLQLARAGFAPAFREELAQAGVEATAPLPEPLRQQFTKWMGYIRDHGGAYITFAPRGAGFTALSGDEKHRTQIRRRFMLLGQTLDSMRVWDIRRALQSVRGLDGLADLPVVFWGNGGAACNALMASLFEPGIQELRLSGLPENDKEWPDYLNVWRVTTPEQLLSLAGKRSKLLLPKSAAKK